MLARRDLLLGWPARAARRRARRAPSRPPRSSAFSALMRARTHGATLAVFRQAMSELGYVEGRHYVIVERFADGRNERLPALAEELVRLKVDLAPRRRRTP